MFQGVIAPEHFSTEIRQGHLVIEIPLKFGPILSNPPAPNPDRATDPRTTLPPPQGALEGRWVELRDALKTFAGVHRQTLLKRLPVARPGYGYLGSRSTYVWVEDPGKDP